MTEWHLCFMNFILLSELPVIKMYKLRYYIIRHLTPLVLSFFFVLLICIALINVSFSEVKHKDDLSIMINAEIPYKYEIRSLSKVTMKL